MKQPHSTGRTIFIAVIAAMLIPVCIDWNTASAMQGGLGNIPHMKALEKKAKVKTFEEKYKRTP